MSYVSRSTGRSSVQSAAYICGVSLYESRRGLTANFSNRQDTVSWSKTFIEGENLDVEALSLWDKLENFEDALSLKRFKTKEGQDRYSQNVRMAKTISLALPVELSFADQKALVEEFVKDNFVSLGLLTTAAIHNDDGNPHAHIQFSTRAVLKKEDGEITFQDLKNREINQRSFLLKIRKDFADLTNKYLQIAGIDKRVTHKSFVDLGLDLEATHHRGWYAQKHESRSRIVFENDEIFKRNKDKILKKPQIILDEMATKQASFTQKDLLNLIHKRVGFGEKEVQFVFESVLSLAHFLGEDVKGLKRYTSSSYLQKEQQTLDMIYRLFDQKNTKAHHIEGDKTKAYLDQHYAFMTNEQRNATFGLTQNTLISVLQGRAGTGKTSTTVKAVCQLYQEEGYTILGGALSKNAADNLGSETGIQSETIHKWLKRWEIYEEAQQSFLSFHHIIDEGLFKQLKWYNDLKNFERFQLTQKTLLVVDEAGMLNNDLYNRLLYFVEKSGAKVIFVGDGHQCSAIGSGHIFIKLEEIAKSRHELFQLTHILRQRLDWMREASMHFSNLETREALLAYEKEGFLQGGERTAILEEIAFKYVSYLESNERNEKGEKRFQTGCVLAYTNQDTHALNQFIREHLRKESLEGFEIHSKDVFVKKNKQGLDEGFDPVLK